VGQGGRSLSCAASQRRIYPVPERPSPPHPRQAASAGEQLRQWRKDGVAFQVRDSETGEDITRVLLA
jgi:hypothetical protein